METLLLFCIVLALIPSLLESIVAIMVVALVVGLILAGVAAVGLLIAIFIPPEYWLYTLAALGMAPYLSVRLKQAIRDKRDRSGA